MNRLAQAMKCMADSDQGDTRSGRNASWRPERSESFFSQILSSIQAGVVLVDVQTRHICYANPACTTLSGYENDQIVGHPCQDMFCLTHSCPILDQKKQLERAERKLITAEGEEIPILKTVRRIFMGDREYLLESFESIAEQKQTERRLERAHEAADREAAKLAAMISGMHEGIVFANEAGIISEVNEYFYHFMGKRREDLLGRDLREFHGMMLTGEIDATLEKFRADPGSQPIIKQRSLHGHEVILRLQPIYRVDKYEGVLLNVIDVTEMVQARKAVEHINRRLQRSIDQSQMLAEKAQAASRAKSHFLANISHEVRTPLNAVIGLLDLIEAEERPELRSEYAQIAKKGALLLLDLLGDILDLSKIEAGRLKLEGTPFDLRELLSQIHAMERLRADNKGLVLERIIDDHLPACFVGDPTRIRQVLMNLIGNAIKFTARGHITLLAECLSINNGLAKIRFSVSDSGIGITAEQMASLFQPFSQADASMTRRYGGTGLGLSICKQLVELMGGEIGVDSQPGMGSNFWFHIPLRICRKQEKAAPPPGPDRFQPGRLANPLPGNDARTAKDARILLVEDNPTNQQVLLAMLNRIGFQADLAGNGLAAIQALAQKSYDLVLMDCQMPELDGLEATRRIRDRQAEVLWPEIPIVALTAHATEGDRQSCLKAGMNDYLSKPVQMESLADMLERNLTRSDSVAPPSEHTCRSSTEHFDQANLIDRIGDDPDLLRRIVSGYIGDMEKKLDDIQEAAATNNADEMRCLSHTVKGASGNAGALRMQGIAATMEKSCRSGEFSHAVALIPDLQDALNAFKRATSGFLTVPEEIP